MRSKTCLKMISKGCNTLKVSTSLLWVKERKQGWEAIWRHLCWETISSTPETSEKHTNLTSQASTVSRPSLHSRISHRCAIPLWLWISKLFPLVTHRRRYRVLSMLLSVQIWKKSNQIKLRGKDRLLIHYKELSSSCMRLWCQKRKQPLTLFFQTTSH